jgi:AraC-like DNA-binding protein
MDILRGLNQAMDYIEQNLWEKIDIETAAKATGYSSYHFSKIFCYLADNVFGGMTERYEKSPAIRLGILNGTQSIPA